MFELNAATVQETIKAATLSSSRESEILAVIASIRESAQAGHAASAIKCAQVVVAELSNTGRPATLARALDALVAAASVAGDIEQVRQALVSLIDLTLEHGTADIAESAIETIRDSILGKMPPDCVPHFLIQIERFSERFERHEMTLSVLISAAYVFSDHGAFQSAYRSLNEAEQLAHKLRRADLLATVLGVMHGICIVEEDHEHAERIWTTLTEIYTDLKLKIPLQDLANRATCLMRMKRHEEAATAFAHALSAIDENHPFRFSLYVNLSVCHRQAGDLERADDAMDEARWALSHVVENDLEIEQVLELELVAAMNAKSGNAHQVTALCLNEASRLLDLAVTRAHKLHFRRGIRERFVHRIENLVATLPSRGRADDVLPIFACTRANQLSDWLHLLKWADDLTPLLDGNEQARLSRAIDTLSNFGAPFLLGHREKYDDGHGPKFIPDAWRDFSEISTQLVKKYSFREPFENATQDEAAKLLKARLDEGYGICISLAAGGGKALLIIRDEYLICSIPEDASRNYFVQLRVRRFEGTTRQELNAAIQSFQTAALVSMNSILCELTNESCKGVILLPDRMDLLPLNLLTVGFEPLRARMAAGMFEVRTCLALFPATPVVGPFPRGIGVMQKEANLHFAAAEIKAVVGSLAKEQVTLVDPAWDDFARAMESSDFLILAHHAVSVGLFVDPHFADMAGETGMSVMSLSSLQESTHRWPHRLVLLGTCHSGSVVNRNSQKEFRSHELVGFPSVFLINRRCMVSAASWAIIDKFSFLLNLLFAKELTALDASKAFSKALANVVSMPAAQAIELLRGGENLLGEAGLSTAGWELEYVQTLKSQAYCYGAYQLYSLL